MMTERCMTQTEVAERWRVSEATLERWRTERCGPIFLKLGHQVRYPQISRQGPVKGRTQSFD